MQIAIYICIQRHISGLVAFATHGNRSRPRGHELESQHISRKILHAHDLFAIIGIQVYIIRILHAVRKRLQVL